MSEENYNSVPEDAAYSTFFLRDGPDSVSGAQDEQLFLSSSSEDGDDIHFFSEEISQVFEAKCTA